VVHAGKSPGSGDDPSAARWQRWLREDIEMVGRLAGIDLVVDGGMKVW
jgi:hypothetical protein